MISSCFQGKTFNITVIQVYAPTTDAKEAEIDQFCEDLEDLIEFTPKKKNIYIYILFITGPWGHTTEHLSLSLKYSSGYSFERKKNHGDRKEFSKQSSIVEHQGSVPLLQFVQMPCLVLIQICWCFCFHLEHSLFWWCAIEILHGRGCYYCSQDGFEFS